MSITDRQLSLVTDIICGSEDTHSEDAIKILLELLHKFAEDKISTVFVFAEQPETKWLGPREFISLDRLLELERDSLVSTRSIKEIEQEMEERRVILHESGDHAALYFSSD